MRINEIKESPQAAAELDAQEALVDVLIVRLHTDCPENGGHGCCGDDGPEGRCPHGWLTAQATLQRQREKELA